MFGTGGFGGYSGKSEQGLMHFREFDPKRLWYQQIFGSFEPDFARFPLFNRFGGFARRIAAVVADVDSVFDEAAVDFDRVDLEE
ncbi:hypothetical protein BLOT_006111 [Blomia tropicalis]|nr:hypothetical protein BLOT_006111 [Blomia tropicalis]